jgi:hypothetical protein
MARMIIIILTFKDWLSRQVQMENEKCEMRNGKSALLLLASRTSLLVRLAVPLRS